jgi:hypothetical protein
VVKCLNNLRSRFYTHELRPAANSGIASACVCEVRGASCHNLKFAASFAKSRRRTVAKPATCPGRHFELNWALFALFGTSLQAGKFGRLVQLGRLAKVATLMPRCDLHAPARSPASTSTRLADISGIKGRPSRVPLSSSVDSISFADRTNTQFPTCTLSALTDAS